jgi:leucyl/phenylalanyl-tRNA---protein transferase
MTAVPVEPSPCPWMFPDVAHADADDLVAMGADLEPGTLLAAYRAGIFPMPGDTDAMLWWSPMERGVLPLDALRVSRSLRQAERRMEIRVDTAFPDVIEACADPTRDSGWIDEQVLDAYTKLHRLGWAHSVEAWQDGELVGGLYGVAIGGLFAGESMFSRRTDASKVALVALVELLRADGDDGRLLDVQWATPHLTSLGVEELPRPTYLARLRRALEVGLPARWA